MANYLLQTKLHIPQSRPKLVPRPRLLERLRIGIDLELTLVSAPAGSGKTTLLSEWATECASHMDVAWLSLDPDDNDAQRFWTYWIAALQVAQPDLARDSLRWLEATQMPPIQSLLTPLINDLAALPNKVLLVLDDYHVLSTPAIHEGLTFLLDHQPPQLHLAISTRADPPLPIARLRARRQITEVRDSDLRFTTTEAATYLNETMRLSLEADDIEALETRTEGWIVGLQLAALSMQGRADAHAFVAAFGGSHHYILEYLTEEVVQCQPEFVRRFLLQTSILDRLCGSLCDALLADEPPSPRMANARTVLAYLDRSNLFVTPIDDEHH
jgi:LuxR family maltose regulon positive regulatory protein